MFYLKDDGVCDETLVDFGVRVGKMAFSLENDALAFSTSATVPELSNKAPSKTLQRNSYVYYRDIGKLVDVTQYNGDEKGVSFPEFLAGGEMIILKRKMTVKVKGNSKKKKIPERFSIIRVTPPIESKASLRDLMIGIDEDIRSLGEKLGDARLDEALLLTMSLKKSAFIARYQTPETILQLDASVRPEAKKEYVEDMIELYQMLNSLGISLREGDRGAAQKLIEETLRLSEESHEKFQ